MFKNKKLVEVYKAKLEELEKDYAVHDSTGCDKNKLYMLGQINMLKDVIEDLKG